MKRFTFLSCFLLLSVTVIAQEPKFRVLGYLHSYNNNWHTDIEMIDLGKITDLNLAFFNPDAAGNFSVSENVRKAIDKAHSQHVRVFFSIGGGGAPAHIGELLKDDKRAVLISKLTALAENFNFDGVDVDLENDLINAQYAVFINELSAALKPKKKLMTAALASWNSNKINDVTLQQFDFINIMSYDKTGPWNLSRPGPHSPVSMAMADFNYYHTKRGIPAERLLIGLPFYGYGFGANAPESIHYKEIIAQYPGAKDTDSVTVNGGGKIYYNGVQSIREKVIFARQNKAAGVMIWELKQDAKGADALLGVIQTAGK
ncbi:hypothetical protein GFS24_22525 [Chitinophaga sp. SYP-B3965]|uniref:glycosyl hydrolase family 18 protein n=1 Tax=Chitinophaga sp. SYP-B3965 TaxID=2663120 RepID=UPI0012999477|nr:glycosyl hydrolase family 18 protein [Chitinophaga sp. SYP-B3965]MRG47915.1 hypothetical protein [Chitinophaga sp. SYP-B3965]